MPRSSLTRFLLLPLVVASLASTSTLVPARGAQKIPTCLIHDGDRWVCLGDSITAANCYPPLLERIFKLYHPDAKLSVINSGQGGDTASSDPQKFASRVLKYDPTVVSIMYGMNEAINTWQPGKETGPIQARYREALTYMVHTLRARGVTVLLMSPSLTDPTAHSYFTLDKTIPILRDCAQIMREVAKSEGAVYVPVQEELEELQDESPPGIILRPDGVHPSALGSYSIARSLSRYAGLDKPLGESRTASTPTPPLAVGVRLANRMLATDTTGTDLVFTSATPVTLQAAWSMGALRQTATIKLGTGTTTWNLPLALDNLPKKNGQSAQLLLDLRTGGWDTLQILDLSRTAVLHLVDDKVAGMVDSPDGQRLVVWRAQRLGDDLQLDFDVRTQEIHSEDTWPFGRDGLNLMLDFRPTPRFADIGVDSEVTQTFLNVREKPFVAVGLRAWTGHGLDFAASAAGERTATGYSVHLLLKDGFNLHTPIQLSKRDFVGLLVAVAQHATPDGKAGFAITANQNNDQPVNLYANNLPILDLKNKIPADSILNAHLTAAYVP